MATASIERVFNHLVLPPKLPGAQDRDIESINKNILHQLTQATVTLDKLVNDEDISSACDALRKSLRQFNSLHELGRLEKDTLVTSFRHLQHNEPLLVYLAEQNAALIIRRNIR